MFDTDDQSNPSLGQRPSAWGYSTSRDFIEKVQTSSETHVPLESQDP